jgi:hypothetical protein
MSQLKLKTAEERAAEIRAESEAIELAQAKKKAEKAAQPAEKAPDEGVQGEPEPDYAALAREEEKRAAQLKQAVDELQIEIDPSLAVKKSKVAAPHVDLAELLNKHDNAEDTLNALHDAIRKMRAEPGLNEKKAHEWPSDLSHLTPSQREKTLAEMAAGKARSEAAADQQARNQKIRREQAMKEDAQKLKLADLQAQLDAARATINVLRHNPVNGKEQFPTIAADKVVSVNGAAQA